MFLDRQLVSTQFVKFAGRLAAAGLVLLLLAGGFSDSSAQQIPIQARLFNETGIPVADGTYEVTVRFYDDPIAGSLLFESIHDLVEIVGGQLSISAGPLPDQSIFSPSAPTVFAGFTIGASSNAELVPRHQVLPSFHSYRADTVLDDGITEPKFDDDAVDTDRIADGAVTLDRLAPEAQAALPSGSVILWWGSLAAIPFGYELCDGATPSTPGATYAGAKPDLRQRFPRGAPAGVTNVATTPVALSNDTIGLRNTGSHSLNEAQTPSHTHGDSIASGGSGNHVHNESNYECASDDSGSSDNHYALGDDNADRACSNITGGHHPHTIVGGISNHVGGQGHSHTIPSHDNRPLHLELFYIIRVI